MGGEGNGRTNKTFADKSKKLLAVAAADMVLTPIGVTARRHADFCAILLPVKCDSRRDGVATTMLTLRGRIAELLTQADRLMHEHRNIVAILYSW